MQAQFNLLREQRDVLDFGISKNLAFKLNFHSQVEVHLLTKGRGEMLIGKEARALTAGDIAFCFSYDAHGFRSEEGAEGFHLIVPTKLLGEYAPLVSDARGRSRFLSDGAVFNRCMAAAERMLQTESDLARHGYALAILGEILDALPRTVSVSEKGERTFPREIMIYINEHYREELSLPSLAAEWGYHPSYLSRVFRETFGISFCKYLSAVRLRECVLRLKAGEGTVTACSMDCGFGSVRSFYRVFEEEFGCSPREYFGK